MAGSASSTLRSAFIAETVPGTIPATPAFTTSHAPIRLSAASDTIEGRSLISQGARLGRAINALDVTGEIAQTELIYGVYDDWLATLLQGGWSGDVLTDAKLVTTNSVENTIPAGQGGTPTMARFRGVEALSGTLSLSARTAAMVNFTLAGRGSEDATTTAVTGATYTDPTEFDPLSSGNDVGTITFDGYTLDCMESAEINFAFENRDLQPRISTDDLCGITRGDFLPVITANMYIEANFLAIYNAARSRTTANFEVNIPIGSVTGEKYLITFPACNFGPANLDFSAASAMQNVEIRPQYSPDDGYVVSITRAVA